MQTIYKYELEIADTQIIRTPIGAKILSVQIQGDSLILWAEHTCGNEEETRVIKLIGTGWSFEDFKKKHLGTILLGPYVWHVYEDLEDRKF